MRFKDFGQCHKMATVLLDAGYDVEIKERRFGKKWELVITD